ncbi:hypothetical protein KL928_003211 [Ogataea angusta]|uniref:D-lactate dehydrogenase (cytochrome) n=1 Tax=Pichia angusta TaxID=870730 RepID=A0AAN6DH62_PICAN|nr:uncharacterized protein KL928_003211 [Ogataea angusta]KAG7818210.1 hypothetical protein KL928_003211 [Ogataea angusta]KAG7858614.1 hypothetical protein KL939_002736 [Ogataea angusta]
MKSTARDFLISSSMFIRHFGINCRGVFKRQFSQRAPANVSWALGMAACVGVVGIASSYGTYQYFRSYPPMDVFPPKATTPLSDLSQSPVYASESTVQAAVKEICQLLRPDQTSVSDGELALHSDNSSNFHKPTEDERPDLVVYPESVDEVVSVVKICSKYRIPMVPYSGGTSIEGHFIPTRRGICIDVGRMNRVLELHEEDLDVVVQPGVGWQDLNAYLDEYGLMFGPDPGPGACIGGMVATNCSGTRATRYGTMKDNVIGLKVVLSDGTVIKTKNRPRKSSAGYNLTGLFVGSEGTLGIIVEATLKLAVQPENEVVAIVNFDKLSEAAQTVTELFRRGLALNAVELMDDRQMRCFAEMGASEGRKWSDKNLLLFKLGGSKNTMNDQIKIVRQICQKNGGFNMEVAADQEEKDEIWRARKVQLWTSIDWAQKMIPNAQAWPTDVAVPISKLPAVITETVNDIESNGLLTTVVGHVGDGNIHALVIFPPEKRAVAEKVVHNMVKRAIENEGTVSGEHGVGIGKREFLEQELGLEAVNTMRRLKLALDPHLLLNPDKIFQIDPHEMRIEK